MRTLWRGASVLLLVLPVSRAVDKLSPARTVTLQATAGSAVLEWVSPSSFHFCRYWNGSGCASRDLPEEQVDVERQEAGTVLILRTKQLEVEIRKPGLELRVATRDGHELLRDLEPVSRENGRLRVERACYPGEQFYGLGPRPLGRADLRGLEVEASKPFLLSSTGYGLYHVSRGTYVFDLGHSVNDRWRMEVRQGETLDYYFYYGPTPKEVFEEHVKVEPGPAGVSGWQFGILGEKQLPDFVTRVSAPGAPSWESLCGTAAALVHASLSGEPIPALDIGPYRFGSLKLFKRAMQVASMAPVLYSSNSVSFEEERVRVEEAAAERRRRWTPFLQAYADEARVRGFPMIHPLAMQFPSDPEAGVLTDEYLIGDEMLVAPACTEDGLRSVYLPMGVWTDWRTNKVYKGRQRIEVRAGDDDLPMFAKNGTIVPLAGLGPAEPMALHYFPKLGAEFFILEPEAADYTQLHASPAGDLIRLDIESKQARSYEWIVHHTPRPMRVWKSETTYQEAASRQGLRAGFWWYDAAQKNLHLRVDAPTPEIQTVHIGY